MFGFGPWPTTSSVQSNPMGVNSDKSSKHLWGNNLFKRHILVATFYRTLLWILRSPIELEMDFTFIFFYLQKPFIHVGDTRFRSAADSKKAAGVRAVLLNSLR